MSAETRLEQSPARMRIGAWILLAACLSACQQRMADQPRVEPLAKSEFFDDERGARPLVEGTVARGRLREDSHLYQGIVNGKPAEAFPFTIDKRMLMRGRERYNIFCAPCHDDVGTGQGMIVRRGYRAPASFHIERLRRTPAGTFFEYITRGFGAMPDYAQQITPEDRWAIIGYIRALQLSQNARIADVPESEHAALKAKE